MGKQFIQKLNNNIMTVNELSIDELNELRETYYDQLLTTDADVLGDITSASEIPLSNVKQHYEGIYFVKDDFFCNIVDDEQKYNAQDDNEELFDYVILDECNRWISTGFQQTQEQIDQEVEELVSNTDLEIFVFQARELIRTSFQGSL